MRLVRWLGSLLSPSGPRAGLSVLIFHRVLPRPDPIFPDTPDREHFDALLSWIGSAFTVLPLDQAIERLGTGRLPARALAITFDDGYADNLTVALPLLQRHRMSATCFVATDFLDGGRMFNDTVIEAVRAAPGDVLDLQELGLGRHDISSPFARRDAILRLLPQLKYLEAMQRDRVTAEIGRRCRATLPDDLMLTASQLRTLRDGGMQIGGHTCSHPILARLDDAAADAEIRLGKQRLEALLGDEIALFAYPNGKPGVDYHARHAAMVRDAGFTAAVTTSPGVARADTDRWQLPRFTPWDRTPLRFGLRLASNMRHAGALAA